MTSDGAAPIEVSEQEVGGLSPSALVVYISPDMLGLWRLRKSLSLDDARWYLDHGRKDAATVCLRGARFSHHQIMRIKFHVRGRTRVAIVHEPGASAPVRPAPILPPSPEVPPLDRLQRRERQYVGLLGQGMDRASIAAAMGIRRECAGVYHSTAAKKLGVASNALAAHVIEQGWGA